MTDHSLPTTDNLSKHTTHDNYNACNTAPKIAIIGAGLTGLFTATLLERAFGQQQDKSTANSSMPQITIFEKSRSVGRLATRYRTDSHSGKNWQWAFGAQFFTAKTATFKQFIAPWLRSTLLQPWCAAVVDLTPARDNVQSPDIKKKEQWDTSQARYISTPKMTSWGRAIADDLHQTTIKFKTQVVPLSKFQAHRAEDGNILKTELFDDNGASLGWFDWVICTAPNGQAVALMADSGFIEQAKITEPKMLACYTLMLGWDNVQQRPETLTNQVGVVWDVAYVHDSLLDRIFIEYHKPAHDELLPSVTIHARNDWSQTHVDDDIETVKMQLLQAAQHALHWNDDTAPSQIDCHRWRYAATVIADSNEVPGILIDRQHQWIVSGDWCGKGNIESCYQMAEETVEAIHQAK